LGPIPNPQSPIPNPHIRILNILEYLFKLIFMEVKKIKFNLQIISNLNENF